MYSTYIKRRITSGFFAKTDASAVSEPIRLIPTAKVLARKTFGTPELPDLRIQLTSPKIDVAGRIRTVATSIDWTTK
jgi:hypothetical protein